MGTTDPRDTDGRDVVVRRWTTSADFAAGEHAGTAYGDGALRFVAPTGDGSYADPYQGRTTPYEHASWTSEWVEPGFPATEAVPSWTADTPVGTWLEVGLRARDAAGGTTPWLVLGRWAAGEDTIARTSVPGQADAHGRVDIDTYRAADGGSFTGWQLRVTLCRTSGVAGGPAVTSLSGMASRVTREWAGTRGPGVAWGVTLDVPRYSQHIHDGEYPQWSGGGEAWCGPTSTAMVLAYWGTGPTPEEYAWVDPTYADPWVDHAARDTYDSDYSGTGNWSFNTAYAARYGVDAFVTRLRSLAEAERFIASGIPLVLSASYAKDQVPGLAYDTGGHLLVLVGFDGAGHPVLNDPASENNEAVRKTVDRTAFEHAWLTTSRGIAYVIRPTQVPLPPAPEQPNW